MAAAIGGHAPDGIVFGATTSGYNDEGGFNGPGEPANQWVTWERTGKVPASGPGCDLWRQPARALDAAVAAGCGVLGLSVEWARVEPEPGALDEHALDRYARLLSMCAERGLAPMVTLHDVAHPWWLGEEYWLMPGSPDRFADHVARVVDRLGHGCTQWVTVHQPNVVALAGWVGGHQPPGRVGALSDAWAVLDNLLAAHLLAYEVIHDRQPGAEVAMGLRASAAYDWHRLLVDLVCARDIGVDDAGLDAWVDERRVLHDLAVPPRTAAELVARRLSAATSPFGGPPSGGPPSGGPAATSTTTGAACRRVRDAVRARLRRPSPRRAVDLLYRGVHPRPLDALVLGWHPPGAAAAGCWWTRAPTGRHGTAGPATTRRWPPAAPWSTRPDPAALAAWCHDQRAFTPGLRMWVEDGLATRAPGAGPKRPGGPRRPDYLRSEVDAVLSAAAGGAPIAGFLCHALADGYEPTWPGATYGLYGVAPAADPAGPPAVRWLDTDATGDRSADAYREVVAGAGAGRRATGRPGAPPDQL